MLSLLHSYQPEVRFMDQGRALERLARFFLGQLAKLIVDEWQELLRGVRIALLHGGQDTRDLVDRGHARA